MGNPCAGTAPLLAVQPVAPRGRPARRPFRHAIDAALRTVGDAVAIAQAAAPNGGAVRVAGLRGGSMRGRRDAATGAVRLRLDRVVYAPGVQVSGTVRGSVRRFGGTFRVSASGRSGLLRLGPGGGWTFAAPRDGAGSGRDVREPHRQRPQRP